MSCRVLTRNTNQDSELFNQLVDIYSEEGRFPIEDWTLQDLVEQGMDSANLYHHLSTSEFIEFFGDWINSPDNAGYLNNQGEPKLFKLGNFHYFKNREGKRYVIKVSNYQGLDSESTYELINSMSASFFKTLDPSKIIKFKINKKDIKSFIDNAIFHFNDLAEAAQKEGDIDKEVANFDVGMLLADNEEALTQDIMQYLKERGLAINEDINNEIEEETGAIDPLNIVDSQNKNSKETATTYTKLFLASVVPQVEFVDGKYKAKRAGILGGQFFVYEEFDKVWNLMESSLAGISNTLHNGEVVDPLELYKKAISSLIDIHPGFHVMLKEINNLPETAQNQLFGAFHKIKNEYRTTSFDKKYRSSELIFKDYNTQRNSPGKKLVSSWSNEIFNTELVNETGQRKVSKFKEVSDTLDKADVYIRKLSKNQVVQESDSIASRLSSHLKSIGIIVDKNAILHHVKYYTTGVELKDKFNAFISNINEDLTSQYFPVKLVKKNELVELYSSSNNIIALAETQALFNGTMEENTIVSDKRFWTYSLPEYNDIILQNAKKGDVEGLLNIQNTEYLKKNEFLSQLIEDPNRFEIQQFFGTKENVTGDFVRDNKGIQFSEHYATNVHKLFMGLRSADNKVKASVRGRSVVPFPVNADKSRYKYLSGFEFIPTNYNSNTRKFDAEVISVFKEYLFAEWRRVQEGFKSKYKDIKYMSENSKKFQLFEDLSYDNITNELSEIIHPQGLYIKDDNGNVAGIRPIKEYNKEATENYINDFLNNLLDKEVSIATKNLIVEEQNSALGLKVVPDYIKNTSEYSVNPKRFLADYMVTQLRANVEIGGVFHGDPAYYKNLPDLLKRYPAAHSDGIYPRITKESERYFNAAVINDVVTDKSQNRKFTISEEEEKNIIKYYTENNLLTKKEILSIISPLVNQGIDTADAQGFMSIDRWKFLTSKILSWSDVHESAYNKMKKSLKEKKIVPMTKEELQISMQPLKMVHFSVDSNGKPTYLKYSLAPLNPIIVNGTRLESVMDKMVEQGIDELITESGVKVGAENITSIYDSKTDTILEDVSFTPFKLENRYSKLQQQLPTKGIKMGEIKSQILKNILDGLSFDDAVYTLKGEKVDGNTILQEINNTIESIVGSQWTRFKNAIQDENGNFNRHKFDELLLGQLTGSSNNIIQTLVEGLPYDLIPEAKAKIEQVIYSQIKKASLKVSMESASFIQVANFGIDRITDISKSGIYLLKDIEGLQMQKFKENEVIPAQVFIPHNIIAEHIPNYRELSLEEFKKKVPDEMLKMIGYRVPNQGMSSNAPIEVAGILPPNMGDQAIVYTGITTITGSDFDIDKMYVMFKSFGADYENKYTMFKKFSEINQNEQKFRFRKEQIESTFNKTFKGSLQFYNYLNNVPLTTIEESWVSEVPESLYNYMLETKEDLLQFRDRFNPKFIGFKEIVEAKEDEDNLTAKQNKLFDLYWSILTSPSNYLNTIRSIDAKGMERNIKELSSDHIEEKVPGEFFTGTSQLEKKVALQQAKGGVGQTANSLVDHVFSVIGDVSYNDKGLLGKHFVHRADDMASLANWYTISTQEGETNQNISWAMSAFLNAFVDVAKDDYITLGNYFSMTNNVAFTMIRSGMDYRLVNAFIGSTAVREYVKMNQIYESPTSPYKSSDEILNEVKKNLEVIGVKPNPHDVFSSSSSNVILDKLKSNNPQDLANTLSLFLNMLDISKKVTNQVRATKLDTDPAKTSIEHIVAKNQINVSLAENDLNNFDNKILNSHLKTFFKYGLMESEAVLSELLWEMSPEGQSILNNASLIIKGSPLLNAEFGKELQKGIVSTMNLIPGLTTNIKISELLNADTGLYSRIQSYLTENNNFFLEKIVPSRTVSGNNTFTFLNLPNLSLTTTENNLIIQGWEELYYDNPQLAVDLYKYAYITTGFNGDMKSIAKFVPTVMRKNIELGDNIYQISDAIKDNLERLFNNESSLETILDIIAQNFYENKHIVRTIRKPKDIARVIKTGIMQLDTDTYSSLVFSGITGKTNYTPYTKISFRNEDTGAVTYRVYKIVGTYKDKTDKLVYKELPRSSIKLGKYNVYDFMGKPSELIHEKVHPNTKMQEELLNHLIETQESFIEHSPLDNVPPQSNVILSGVDNLLGRINNEVQEEALATEQSEETAELVKPDNIPQEEWDAMSQRDRKKIIDCIRKKD